MGVVSIYPTRILRHGWVVSVKMASSRRISTQANPDPSSQDVLNFSLNYHGQKHSGARPPPVRPETTVVLTIIMQIETRTARWESKYDRRIHTYAWRDRAPYPME